jgi:4-aminobutyrate aminotransferase/(S)-3-amino-2-methylpropionate transaminase
MKNKTWFERLQIIESPDATWCPKDFFTVLERAKGSYIWDVEGRRYIDMVAGFGALPLGHNHDEVYASLHTSQDFIVQGMGDVYPSRFKIEFIEKLLSFLPETFSRAALAATGSQAVELAMKTAILATGGAGFISFKGAYHGLDLGCLALTENRYFRDPFLAWLNLQNVQQLSFECTEDELRAAMQAFRKHNIKPAAVIVEPILGRGGFRAASSEWLKLLKKICEEEKCLLIFDEVFTGFGRSGRVTFAEEHPCDLICFGKSIGGGMPLSVCVGSELIMKAWPENSGEAIHTGTFFGHPYSCRVGLRTLECIEEKDLVSRAKDLGASVLNKWKPILSQFPRVKDMRGEGLMLAVEFFKAEDSLFSMMELRKRGVFVIPCGVKGECVSFTPALNVENDVLNQVFECLVDVVKRMEEK